MAEIERQTMPSSDAMQFVKEASNIGLKVAEPYKAIMKWLIAALVITNLIWGTLFIYETYKAYENPIEVQQTQELPDQTQEQNMKAS